MSSHKKYIRDKFRNEVFERDKYMCQICGAKYSKEQSDIKLGIINAHHIIDRNLLPNGGYVKENGITVCDFNGNFLGNKSCHYLVELWHKEFDKSKIPDEHCPEFLLSRIGSSFELALNESKKINKNYL